MQASFFYRSSVTESSQLATRVKSAWELRSIIRKCEFPTIPSEGKSMMSMPVPSGSKDAQ